MNEKEESVIVIDRNDFQFFNQLTRSKSRKYYCVFKDYILQIKDLKISESSSFS